MCFLSIHHGISEKGSCTYQVVQDFLQQFVSDKEGSIRKGQPQTSTNKMTSDCHNL